MKRHSIVLFAILLSTILLTGCAERQDAVLDGSGQDVLALISRTAVRGVANDVAVADNLAYVADEPYGISIYELSDPANPVLVDSLELLIGSIPELIAIDPGGRIAAIQVSDQNNVQLYDLQTKQFMFTVGSGNHIEIELEFVGNTLTILRCDQDSQDGLNYDRYTDPLTTPTVSFTTNYTAPTEFKLFGFAWGAEDTVFVCQDLGGLAVIDCNVPAQGDYIGGMNTPGKASDASLAEDILCIAAGYEGLLTIDVSDVNNMEILGSLIIDYATDIEWVEAIGSQAYLLDDNDGVFAVDISDPANPVLVGEMITSNPNNFCIAGDLILVADEDEGLVIGQILNEVTDL